VSKESAVTVSARFAGLVLFFFGERERENTCSFTVRLETAQEVVKVGKYNSRTPVL